LSALAAALLTALPPITKAASLRELAVDLLEVEHVVIGDVGLGDGTRLGV
jgi:hypothetical protein